MTMARYAKFITALVGAVGTVAASWPAGAPGWLNELVAFGTALGVLMVPNAPPARDADPSEPGDWF